MEAWIPVVMEVLRLITGLIGHQETLNLLAVLQANRLADEAERKKFGSAG